MSLPDVLPERERDYVLGFQLII
uniref:Uncharacterized protein n=1 Tax=Rhizophora mucronata TaxID=61149 RepID=A0A2P2PQN5_RHIMU